MEHKSNFSQKIIQNFLRYLISKGVSTSSLKYYKSDISNFLSWAGDRKVDNKLVREYINSERLTTPLSTLNRRLSTLRSYANFVDQDFMNGVENVTNFRKTARSWQEAILSKFEARPKIKNLFTKILFNRPNWYRKYHSYALANYIHIAILILFSSLSGYAVYDQVFYSTDRSLAFPTALTRPNRYLSFQGRLTDNLGNPETTATNIVFRLYDASSGGSTLWNSGTCSITPDQDGIFSTLLGSSCGSEIASSVFSENASVWLGVTVGADAEATPRIQIATVAYALNAETLQGFPAGTGTSTIPYINSSGTVVLANASPKIQSTSGTFAVEGQALTITTPNTSNGIITINPDGTGTLDLTFEGAAPGGSANGFVNATNANITSGSLYSGTVASNATGYNFINFLSGASPASVFSVQNDGDIVTSGDITIGGGNINTGNIALTIGDATTDSITLTTDGTGNGEVVLPNDSIGPNEILSSGQTDEYCLTYEASGTTFEWQTCGAGGGGAWSDITAPIADLTLSMAAYNTVFNWDPGADSAETNFSLTIQGEDTVGADEDQILMALSQTSNAVDVTQAADALLTFANNDSNDPVINGIRFDAGAAGTDFTYGINFDAASFGTAELILSNAETISNLVDGTIQLTSPTVSTSGNLSISGTTGLTFAGTGGDITFTNGEKIDNDTDGTLALTSPTTALSGDLTFTDDNWLGLGSSAGLIEFDDQATDEVNILNANLGIGTSGPDAKVDSLSTSGEQLRLTYTDGSVYSGFTLDSNGYLIIDPTGARIALDGSLQVGSTSSLAYSRFGTATTDHAGNITASNDVLVSGDVELDGVLYLDGGNIANSAGTASIILSSTPTTTANTLSASNWLVENTANVGQAALMVNQTKSGDLFTASSSGTPKFTIHNDGSITLATDIASTTNTIEGTIFYDNNSAGSSSTDHLFLYGSDSAWHRIALDMTKYASSAANIVNQNYIEIAHNQNTNDLNLTAWVKSKVTGLWEKFTNFTTQIVHNLGNQFNATYAQKQKTSQVAIQYNENDLGNGADGAATFSADTNINTASGVGRSCGDAVNYSVSSLTSTTATLEQAPSSTCLAVNDEVLIINLRGTNSAYTNVGNYETLRIQSISSNTITFTTNKTKYYGDNANDDTNIGLGTGNQAVMLQRVPNYTNVTVSNSGTDVTPNDWTAPTGSADANTETASSSAGEGGVLFFRASGTVSIASGTTINANAKGYIGGAAQVSGNAGGNGGEAFCGAGGAGGNSANGSNGAGGGGAGYSTFSGGNGLCGGGGGASVSTGTAGSGSASLGGAGGGGGGYQGAGGAGGYGSGGTGGGGNNSGTSGGTNTSGAGGAIGGSGNGGGGGGTYGDTALSDLMFGSSGGSGTWNSSAAGEGGDGGGVVYIAASTVTLTSTGAIQSNGAAGGAGAGSSRGGGGGGAGGSVKIIGNTLNLGTSLVTATGGAGGVGSTYTGGTGGTGRIAVYYSSSIATSSNPAWTASSLNYNTYAVFVSNEINTPNATAYGNLSWTETLPSGGNIQFQTRSGATPDSTDGTWEDWKPYTGSGTNYTDINTMNTPADWTATNNNTPTDGESSITRNVDYYEYDNELDGTNTTKFGSVGSAAGYNEDTISTIDLTGYDYITAWVYATSSGTIAKFGFGESAATEQEENISIDTVNTWQKIYWPLNDLTSGSCTGGDGCNQVDNFRISITQTNTTLYVDNIRAEKALLTTSSGSAITSTPNNYFQYRAILTTTNTANQPYFSDVLMGYTNPVSTYTIDANSVRQNNDASYYSSRRLAVTESNLNSSKSINTNSGESNISINPAYNLGTGTDGAITVSNDTSINTTNLILGRVCTDGGDAVNYSVTTLTSTTATLESAPSTGCLAVGDEILLINLRGSSSAFVNVGNYETLKISSIVSNVITFTSSKTKYYGDNTADDTNIGLGTGNQAVMLQRVPNYTNVTVSTSGTDFYPDEWVSPTGTVNNGAGEGGVLFFRASGTVSIASGTTINANAKGYIGGIAQATGNEGGYGGEAFCGAGGTGGVGAVGGTGAGGGGGGYSTYSGGTGLCGGGGGANTSSGSGGSGSASLGGAGGGGGGYQGSGGGGGYGSGGTGGGGANNGSSGGTNTSGAGGSSGTGGAGGGGGGTYGDTALSDLMFGSSGGGGTWNSSAAGAGGDGGGVVYIAASTVTLTSTGAIQSNGGAGGAGVGSARGGGGGGAGGSVKIIGNTLTLGSSLVTATGGAGGVGSPYTGGTGGTGRIATAYASAISGQSSPAYESASVENNNYAIFVSDEINTPNAVGYDKINFNFDKNKYGMVQFQTRSGKSSNSTDGSWEAWKPTTAVTTVQNMNTESDFSGTFTASDNTAITRNKDMFEDEDETTTGNITKFKSTGFSNDTSATLDASLYAYWPMNETSSVAGTQVTRYDAYSTNHLTDNRSATSYIQSATGKNSNAADLESANSNFFELSDNSYVSTGDIDFTVAAWVNLESTGANRVIMSKSAAGASAGEYELFFNNSTTRFNFNLLNSSGSTVCTVADTTAVSTATWYYVVAWHDATANNCYIQVNNNTASSAAESGTVSDSAANFRIGARYTTEELFFDGLIDEVGFWKKVLTSTERTDLYNTTSGSFYPTSSQYSEDTFTPSQDLSSYDMLSAWVYSSKAGPSFKLGFGESAATENEETFSVMQANTWQKVYWNITDIDEVNRDGVTKLRITNLSSDHTLYVDNVKAESLLDGSSGAYNISSTPNEYIQYRAILTTTDSAFKPYLYNINIDWNNGYKIVQTDANKVRLYNYTGETQEIKLDAVVFGADLAEWYTIYDKTIGPGDLVSLTGTLDEFGVPVLEKAKIANDPKLVGAISTKAGQALGIEAENRRLLGLAGRIPVKIDPNSPDIKTGDELTSSSLSGYATLAMTGDRTIGKATENWTKESGKETVLILIDNSYAPEPTTIASNVYRYLYSAGQLVDQTTGRVVEKIGAFAIVITPEVKTTIISPIANTDLVIDLDPENATQSSKLAIKGVDNTEVASIDALGNAEFDGTITSQDLVVTNDATISGTLYADDIKSTKLDQIENLLREVEDNQNILASTQSWEANTATDSGNVIAANIQTQDLFVTGIAAIDTLSVTSSISFGNDFVFQSEENSINTLVAPLKIQSLALAPLEIMAGKITVDTNGDTKFTGNVAIAGNLDVSGTTNIKSAILENLIVATNSQEGQNSNEIIIGEISTNSVAGKALLPANTEKIRINNPKVKESTLVYVTPITTTQNKVLFVKSKGDGYFEIGFNENLDSDVEFNWWIIELKDIGLEGAN